MNAPTNPPAVRQARISALIREAAEPGRLRELLGELVDSREALRVIRSQRRCLPRHAQAALEAVPHRRPTAVEFPQD